MSAEFEAHGVWRHAFAPAGVEFVGKPPLVSGEDCPLCRYGTIVRNRCIDCGHMYRPETLKKWKDARNGK